jgi:hypothetical protein
VIFPLLLLAILTDVRGCVCDPAKSETMEARACSLTHVALAQAGTAPVIFQKDVNPTKPNRVLAIPHTLRHTLTEMTAAERQVYWSATIAKATDLWGGKWAIAVNSEERRSQCQMHAHIGQLLEDADTSGGTLVDSPADIPVPDNGGGIWIRPDSGKLRVYPGDLSPETKLMR